MNIETPAMRSVQDFQRAFQVEPTKKTDRRLPSGVGLCVWVTPQMEGFELQATDDLVIALHLGGSREVRAMDSGMPSRSRSMPGKLTVLAPERSASFLTEGKVHLISLHIAKDALNPDWHWSSRFAFHDSYARAAMDAMLEAILRPRAAQDEYLAEISRSLLFHLARSLPTATPQYPNLPRVPELQQALAQIDADLGAPLDIESLARCTGLSRSTFLRRFRQHCGESPHQYILARRILAAQSQLAEPCLDLARMAHDLGFSSQSHFTSAFRRATGLTPLQYRIIRTK